MFELDDLDGNHDALDDIEQLLMLNGTAGGNSISVMITDTELKRLKARHVKSKAAVRNRSRRLIRWDYRGLVDPT